MVADELTPLFLVVLPPPLIAYCIVAVYVRYRI